MTKGDWISLILIDVTLRVVVALVLVFAIWVLIDMSDHPYTETGWRRATKETWGPTRWAWVVAYELTHLRVRKKNDEGSSESVFGAGGASSTSTLGGGHHRVLSKRPGIADHRELSDGAGGAGTPASHRGEDQDEKPENQGAEAGAKAEGEVPVVPSHGAPHGGASARRRGRAERSESGGLDEDEYNSEFWKTLVRRGNQMGL